MSQQINLANPQLLHKRYAFGLREMAIGVGLALVAALGWAVVQHDRARTLDAEAVALETRLAAAQQALDAQRAAAERPASALLTGRLEAAQAQIGQREALLAALGDAPGGAASGFAARLRALSNSHTDGVWLNGFVLAPDRVVLTGSALHAGLVTQYLDRLGRQGPFAGLRFSGLQAGAAQRSPQPTGDASPDAARPAGQIDFELVAGSTDREEGSHGR